MNNTDMSLIGSFVGFWIFLFFFFLLVSINEANNWAKFSETHDCKIFAVLRTSYEIMANGEINSVVRKRGWRCNNGREYWR